jgi:hypothetical protein
MRLYLLFPTVKTAGLYLLPIKSYSKNTQGSSILKWIIIAIASGELDSQHFLSMMIYNISVRINEIFDDKEHLTLIQYYED